MHIAHIQGIFSPEHGGPAKSLTNYCRSQTNAGHRVSAWVLDGFPNASAAIRLKPPVEMRVCGVDSPARLGRSAAMRRQLREAESPDIYHLHGAWLRAMHYGAVEARRRRRPYILELMGMFEPWALRQKRLQKRIARWWFQDAILRGAACLHVNSEQEAEFTRKLGFKAPIAVIPVGVDLEALLASKSEIRNQKSEIQAGLISKLDGQPFVLYLSRLHPKKGLDLLLRAWAQVQRPEARGQQAELGGQSSVVCRPSSEWRLVIAGTGDPTYTEKCWRLAEDLGISNQCLWLGHVDEAQKSWLLTNAHCYVLPTSSENFGNVVVEALAHGTPVITTRNTPWTDLPKNNCGWLVDNTEAELRRVLREAMQMDAATRREMGHNGDKLVRSHYSLDLVNANLLAVYEWVLGGGERPECVWMQG